MQRFNHPHLIYFFLIILLVVGSLLVRDFGISWDEDAQIAIGQKSYDYLTKGDKSLFTFCDRDYGVGFELPVYAFQQLFKDPKSMYYFRHACVHLFFLLGVFFFYKSLLLLFRSQKNRYALALLGVLFLIFSPRIYAESFYNSKDIVLLSASCLYFYALLRCIQKPDWKATLVFAMATAYLIDIRIVGILHFAMAFVWFMYRIITASDQRKNWIRMGVIFSVGTPLILYLIWPYLYENPFERFWNAYRSMKQFRWNFDVVFMGEVMLSSKIPWYYSLGWIAVTTPVLYLVLGGVGILTSFVKAVRSKLQDAPSLNALTALGLFAGPLLATILFHSVLYDGWRQLYFVYPFFLVLAVYGFYQLGQLAPLVFQRWLAWITATQFIMVIWFIVQHHPFQMVYFNELPAKGRQELLMNYDRDYWGLSYRQAYEQLNRLLDVRKQDTVRVVVQNIPGRFNALFASDHLKSKLKIYQASEVPEAEQNMMQYFITNFRKEPKTALKRCTQKLWHAEVQGSDVIAIYQLKGQEDCYE
ncbi:MAG: hypothetical protein JNM44_11345 [Chitinophagaceae bacterium]|nr:hypothetical protein [Chitinophagaceae bacterium]